MWATRAKVAVVLILLALIGLIFLLNIIGNICPPELIAPTEGTPLILVRNSDLLLTSISQIVTDNNNIYILYGTYSVVQVYGKDGSYQYSLSVFNHTNGRTEIAVSNNRLYICDKISNVYVFENGTFMDFLDRSESANLRKKLPFGASNTAYDVRSGSVWYTPDHKEAYCLIQRPTWLNLYQHDLNLRIFFLIIMIQVILVIPSRKTEKT